MSKPKFYVAVKNEASSSTLELHFLDYIRNEFDWNTWEEKRMVADTIKQVNSAAPKKIKLVIDSQGGDAAIGLALYNFLKNHAAEVETEVIGMAGSIASVIAMAANPGKFKIARNAFVIIHQAWGGAVGNSSELRAAADVIDKFTNQIVDIYQQRTGKPAEDINALIANGDYWMTGEEAVEQGFADELFAGNEAFQIAARVKDLDPNYRNIPKALINPAAELPDGTNIFSTIKNELMVIVNNIKTAFAALKTPVAPAENPATPETPAAAPANNDLIEQIEAALTPSFQTIENALTALEPKEGEPTIAEMRQQLADANAAIKVLQDDLANVMGGESKEVKDPANTVKGIGSFA